ncbi:MAG TPA: hypothetical protein VES67_26010 [Vicinamibacterales bacterium]|nr:hypothetical protein [Vicinamibacterales bacterium]
MTGTASARTSNDRRHPGREHPEATLAVTVVFGVVAMGWFVVCVWFLLNGGASLS